MFAVEVSSVYKVIGFCGHHTYLDLSIVTEEDVVTV